jgi:arabinofuranosyltransferase
LQRSANSAFSTSATAERAPTITGTEEPGQAAARRRLTVLLAAFSVYAFALIWRTSFLVRGERYFCLVDDAMISMRYAANLAHGYGLVWNPGGPRVEGYTNLLWVLYMAIFHLLPISPSKISLCLQATGWALLTINLIYVRRLARDLAHGSESVALAAVALTAFYFPLDNWALRGSEVAVLTPVVTIATWTALQRMRAGTSRIPLYLMLGAATLVRPDMAVTAGIILLSVAAIEPGPIAQRFRHLAIGGAIIAIFVGADTAFRLSYYGDLLPNTYYLKLTGFPLLPRLTRGLMVMLGFLGQIAPVLIVIYYSRVLRRLRPATALLVCVIGGQMLYSIWVGGDAWEWWFGSNRYVSIVMPLVMVLAAYAIRLRVRRNRDHTESAGASARVGFRAAMILPVVFVIVTANALNLSELLLIRQPPEIDYNRVLVYDAVLIRATTRPAAKIAVVCAGIIPYFADRFAIDLLGMNDRKVAHEPMHVATGWRRFVDFYPGHLKWDYRYSIDQLQPDLVQVLPVPAEQPNLAHDYVTVNLPGYGWYGRTGSANVLWDRIRALPPPH